MEHLSAKNISRATFKDNTLEISTPSCGCCANSYSTDDNHQYTAWTLPVDELVKYVDAEQDRLEALKDLIIENEGDSITFTPSEE